MSTVQSSDDDFTTDVQEVIDRLKIIIRGRIDRGITSSVFRPTTLVSTLHTTLSTVYEAFSNLEQDDAFKSEGITLRNHDSGYWRTYMAERTEGARAPYHATAPLIPRRVWPTS